MGKGKLEYYQRGTRSDKNQHYFKRLEMTMFPIFSSPHSSFKTLLLLIIFPYFLLHLFVVFSTFSIVSTLLHRDKRRHSY